MITSNHRGLLALAADTDANTTSGAAAPEATTNGSAPSPETSTTPTSEEEPDYEALLNAHGSKLDETGAVLDADFNAEIPKAGTKAAEDKTPAANDTPPAEDGNDPDDDDEETAPAAPNADGTPKKDANNFRLNLKDATDKERKAAFVRLLKNEPGVTLEEAARRTGVKLDAATPAPGTKPDAAPAADDPRKGLRDDIARLQTESDTAAEQEFDFAKARKLDKQIAAKQRELDQLEYQAGQQAEAERSQTAQTQAQKHEQAVNDSWKGIADLYPDAGKEGSEFYTKLSEAINEKHASNPKFFENPDWPTLITIPLAAKLRITPKAPAASAPAAPAAPAKPTATAPAVTPKKTLAPVPPAAAPGGTTGGGSVPAWTPEWGSIEDYLDKFGTKITAA